MMSFIVPVRHPENSPDWASLKANLAQTARSIAAQTSDDWQAVVIANRGADLPKLPTNFSIEWVDFEPNRHHKREGVATEEFLDAVRLDKGRRVLKGLLRARESRFLMVVDDDDFISARLTQYAADHPDANGWVVDHGYVWDDGSNMLYRHSALNHVCGSSLIVRSDLYQ